MLINIWVQCVLSVKRFSQLECVSWDDKAMKEIMIKRRILRKKTLLQFLKKSCFTRTNCFLSKDIGNLKWHYFFRNCMSFEQMRMNGEIIVLTKGCIIKNHKDVYICSMSAKKIEKYLMYQWNQNVLSSQNSMNNVYDTPVKEN